MVSTLGANYVGRGLNSTTALWGDNLMVGNPRDLSHLRVRELCVRVVISLIITQMYFTPCQIRVQVSRDNDCTKYDNWWCEWFSCPVQSGYRTPMPINPDHYQYFGKPMCLVYPIPWQRINMTCNGQHYLCSRWGV